jgi:PAS domain S-box-containing protein
MHMLLPFTLSEIIVITLILGIGVVLISIREKGEIGYSAILAFGFFLIFSVLFYTAMLHGLIKVAGLPLCLLCFFFLGLPASVLAFSLDALVGKKWLSILAIALIAILPVLMQSFFINRAAQGLFLINGPFDSFEIIYQQGGMGWLSLFYSTGIIVAALIVLARSIDFRLPVHQNRSLIAVFIAGLISVLLDLLGFRGFAPVAKPLLDFLGFAMIGVAFIYYRLTFDVKKGDQVRGDEVLDHLEDGIIVLNGSDYITKMNPAAEQIVGITAQEANGRQIDHIFLNWNLINSNKDSENEMGFKASVFIQQEWRYLDVRIIPMDGGNPANGSKILIVRDMSNLKTDARQYARETMFVFLRSLVNAFKDSQTIQEFLEHALYQTLYTFNLEDGFIYHLDAANRSGKLMFTLAARHGSLDGKAILARIYPPNRFTLSDVNTEPLIINDVKKDERFSPYFSAMTYDFSLAFFPLSVEQEIVGMLVLGQTQVNGFNTYNVMRLGAAADEIASFILKEREKQQQIAFLERQRLVRDLHDSITQKLYGLLTITEAVQVGLEAGAIDQAIKLMSKVSENARQAVREMRLFLHQLDPVDIEREGFVSALRQRLVAVEGHANIKVNFKVTGKFSFSKEKERTIYYIAEEALNNILKHAQAKNILVRLRRRGGWVYLDIIDDGCSFDPAKTQPGGRGLHNMKARAAQIGAALAIVSGRKKGTKVSLSFLE